MTENIWIDLQMSQILRPSYPTYLASYPIYLPWVMQWAAWAQRERSTMHSTSTACLAVRARSRRWPRGRFPDTSVLISPDDDHRAGACAPLTPGSEDAGSRANGFR
jgi:hypothetical protein